MAVDSSRDPNPSPNLLNHLMLQMVDLENKINDDMQHMHDIMHHMETSIRSLERQIEELEEDLQSKPKPPHPRIPNKTPDPPKGNKPPRGNNRIKQQNWNEDYRKFQ